MNALSALFCYVKVCAFFAIETSSTVMRPRQLNRFEIAASFVALCFRFDPSRFRRREKGRMSQTPRRQFRTMEFRRHLEKFSIWTSLALSCISIEVVAELSCDGCLDYYGACRKNGDSWTDDETWRYSCQKRTLKFDGTCFVLYDIMYGS